MTELFLHPQTKGMVSCVIPAFNAARYLAEAVASIAAQSLAAVEVIIADDGSQDDTATIASALNSSGISAGIKLLQQPNAGSPAARNLGLSEARGEFIALLDADDLWLPGKLAAQLAVFDTNAEMGACTTWMQNIWEEEFAHEAEANPQLAAPQPGVASTFLGRREVFEQIGGFDASVRHRDVQEWMMRAKLAGWQLHTIKDVWVHRRIHGNNASRQRLTGQSELLDMASQLLARKRKQRG